MITYCTGDLFDAQTEAIVNTVNTVGVMGKGIALQFKERFPKNYLAYREAFERGQLQIGKMLVTETGDLFYKYIINFPTKKHWRHPSEYEYVEQGLVALVQTIEEQKIQSIALPPLGAGNGKLEWEKVKKLIEAYLGRLPGVDVFVFEPQQEFESRNTLLKSEVKITTARALLLDAFIHYNEVDGSLNLLVAQKIAYFLQRFGEPLRLQYAKGWYGPYAPNLNKVLQTLNGVYIHYQAQYDKPSAQINIAEGTAGAIEPALAALNPEQSKRLHYLKNFMQGFETPFSMELLATVDWILLEHPNATPQTILDHIGEWTKRKASLIKPHHIRVAFQHLENHREYLYPNTREWPPTKTPNTP